MACDSWAKVKKNLQLAVEKVEGKGACWLLAVVGQVARYTWRRLSVTAGPRHSWWTHHGLGHGTCAAGSSTPSIPPQKSRIADLQSECLCRRDFACPELNTGVPQILRKLVALARVDVGDSIAGLPTV